MNEDTLARRALLRRGGAALALAAASGPAAAAAPQLLVRRARFGIPADTALPQADVAYVLPFSTVVFQEGKDCTLLPDNTVRIENAGLYRVCLGCDWPGQYGVDVDLRTYGTRLVPAGRARRFAAVPGELTPIPDDDTKLATIDMPGSDPPQTVRWQGTWTPGPIAKGAVAWVDVTLPTTNIVTLGDLAFAGLDSISDATLGAEAVAALIVSAKPLSADKVRVSIYNPSIAGGVNVPAGQLRVVAMSAVNTRGESADAWTVLQSTTQSFAAGDVVYAMFRSRTQGDFLQTSLSSFLQVERWG